MKNLIFVYGTLKRGHRNHYHLEHCKFMGEAQTSERYLMINVGFPVILDPNGADDPADRIAQVRGELYMLKKGKIEETMKRLDQLEGEGRMYNRVKGSVYVCGDVYKLGQGWYEASYYVGVSEAWRRNVPRGFVEAAHVWPPSPSTPRARRTTSRNDRNASKRPARPSVTKR